MTHKVLIAIGTLIYPVIAFLFLCLLGFNNHCGKRKPEPENEPERETEKEQK